MVLALDATINAIYHTGITGENSIYIDPRVGSVKGMMFSSGNLGMTKRQDPSAA